MRRFAMLAVAVTMIAGPANATPIPVVEEPVLRPDTQWTQTSWGYQHSSLVFPSGTYKWPTMMTMEGYAGASRPAPNAYLRMDDGELMALRLSFGAGPRGDYLSLQASTRGTECSGGSFNLYDKRHAWDGHHIIEWAAAQPWSNKAVGMYGSSFPGQTAYWVAATQPPHLKAISANLLHSDIYRDIFMPGGVQNYLFPTLWTYAAGPHRLPQDSVQRNVFQNDEICVQNQATRYSAGDVPQAQNEPAWAAARSVDDQWYIAHAALTYAPAIKIPYYMQNNWQDEQVGPRSAVLWHHIHPDPKTIIGKDGQPRTVIPKKMALASGDHGWGDYAPRERWAWMDIWLLGMPDVAGLMDSPVTNYFEAQANGNAAAVHRGDAWPFPDTDWRNIYLGADGSLGFEPPAVAGDRAYVSGASRQNYFLYADGTDVGDAIDGVAAVEGLPDQLEYRTGALDQDLAIAGPIQMDLYATLAGTDADFFVSISDEWPDGSVSYLQRGLLKASHRRIDPLRSYYADTQAGRLMVQPYRPHTNPQPVIPGEMNMYRIEIFPLGHVFRKDHKIVVKIHTPPVTDGIWGYTPTHHQPAPVVVHHGGAHQTSIQLPVVPLETPAAATSDCRVPAGFPCYPKPARIG